MRVVRLPIGCAAQVQIRTTKHVVGRIDFRDLSGPHRGRRNAVDVGFLRNIDRSSRLVGSDAQNDVMKTGLIGWPRREDVTLALPDQDSGWRQSRCREASCRHTKTDVV